MALFIGSLIVYVLFANSFEALEREIRAGFIEAQDPLDKLLRETVEDNITDIVDLLAVTAAEAASKFDFAELQQYAETSIDNDHIASVVFYDRNGSVLAIAIDQSDLLNGPIVTRDVERHGHNFGKVEITLTFAKRDEISSATNQALNALESSIERPILETKKSASARAGIATLALIITLFLVTYYALRRTLFNPLKYMIDKMCCLATIDEIEVEIRYVERSDEIGDMARAIHAFLTNAVERSRFAKEVSEQAEALRIALDQAEEGRRSAQMTNEAKSRFLANMSHELRTPMNGVFGVTELLLETGMTQTQRQYGETVLNSADSLLSLLNDILDYSKIEAVQLELDLVPVDLLTLVEEVVALLSARAIGAWIS